PAALKAYLVAYNVLSTLGWGYILTLTLIHIFNLDRKSDSLPSPALKDKPWLSRQFSSSSSVGASLPGVLQPIYQRATTTYSRVGSQTTFVQSFAILEVVHALLGWVRSPIQTTAMQVASRLFLVWGVTEQFPEVRSNPFFTSMVFAWSFTEVIRYSFYAFNLVGMNPYPLLWLRYTTFYILYPLGASSEAFVNLATLPSSIKAWQLTDYVRAVLFAIWWPGLYIMYTYMIVQRRKVLGKPKSIKSE
ncbi:tyrosine phosphatase-like protein, partial [Crepidotus variabilis]